MCADNLFTAETQRNAEIRRENKTPPKNRPPRSCWETARGPSSTPSDEEGFIHGVWTDAKGSVRPDIKESARTVPAYGRGSTGKCSPACLQAQTVWRKSHLRLR